MLKIAIPNKGMLSEPAWNLLQEAGYKLRTHSRQLVVDDEENGIQLFYLRPLDIAVYVGSGIIDLGITGRDMLLNSQTEAIEQMKLGFGASTFRFAAPPSSGINSVEQLDGKRIATSFDKIVADYLHSKGLSAQIVHLDGAVESSVQLGVADAIADVVSTGTTLRNAGLSIFGDPIVSSEAIVVRAPSIEENNPELVVFQRRLQGVLTAHSYVLMDYDIPVERVSAAVAITPGFESPTVSALHDSQWAAVRAMVPRSQVNTLMDQLYDVGARAIIITAIQASRM